MTDKYILDDNGEPVACSELMDWAAWFGTAKRHVKDERLSVFGQGEVRISTIFLGLDHSFGEGAPVLWETMVFGGKLDQEEDRCGGSRTDAEAMHARMVAKVQEAT